MGGQSGGFPQDFDPASLWGGFGLPEGVSVGGPDPYQGAPAEGPIVGAPPGLEPWNYQVPNPSVPKPAPPHVDFEDFPGGRGGGGRRGNRRARKRNRFFDQLQGGHKPPNKYWDR